MASSVDSSKILALIDAAWAIYASLPLPVPSPERLLARGSIPRDHLGFFRQHYGIPDSVNIGISYENLPNPGYVRVVSTRQFDIAVNSSYRGWHDAETAVLSHEMSHVVMKIYGFSMADRFREEVYTDSFAIFLGSCLLANFSESVDFYDNHSQSMRLGYLKPVERDYAVSVFLAAAGIPTPRSPAPPWRRSDMSGLPAATECHHTRRLKITQAYRSLPPHCPVCDNALTVESAFASCALCASCWRRGIWKWSSTPPTKELLRQLGVGYFSGSDVP